MKEEHRWIGAWDLFIEERLKCVVLVEQMQINEQYNLVISQWIALYIRL